MENSAFHPSAVSDIHRYDANIENVERQLEADIQREKTQYPVANEHSHSCYLPGLGAMACRTLCSRLSRNTEPSERRPHKGTTHIFALFPEGRTRVYLTF
ncbi:hypothetical protein BDN72DRAFT_89173 [Pluteus cervinus]|uniref:Uncharacterized protein n=1 Tax=Pluteus cervinus TaxID=181527 RepID=A0ACD3AQU0_9AGAR|nr:hypothetical protein BDN72DRAFT_89173 [Pluteus cervinus]